MIWRRTNPSLACQMRGKDLKIHTGCVSRAKLDLAFGKTWGAAKDANIPTVGHSIECLETTIEFNSAMIRDEAKIELSLLRTKSISIEEQGNQLLARWTPRAVRGVSVVAALYENDISELEAFLSSLLISFKNLIAEGKEIILVDDASVKFKSMRRKILEFSPQFEAENIVVTILEKRSNEGPGAARNLGAKKARFPNLLFVDSDDLVHTLYLQAFAQELDLGSTFVSCDMEYPDGHLFLGSASDFPETLLKNGNGSCIGLRKDHPIIANMITNGQLYSSQKLAHYEDWELNLVLKGIGVPITILPIPLYFYRQKGTGRDSSNAEQRLISRYKCFESAWVRLNDLSKTNSIPTHAPCFLPVYQLLLSHYESTFSNSGLSKLKFRQKMLRLIMKAITKFIWPKGTPVWINALKAKFGPS